MTSSEEPLSSELGTDTTVKARFWPGLEPFCVREVDIHREVDGERECEEHRAHLVLQHPDLHLKVDTRKWLTFVSCQAKVVNLRKSLHS